MRNKNYVKKRGIKMNEIVVKTEIQLYEIVVDSLKTTIFKLNIKKKIYCLINFD